MTGTVDADGAASARMASVVDGPAWDAPPDGDLVLTVLDSAGGEPHREPPRTSLVSHSGGARSRSARVPRVEGAAGIVVRSSEHGDVRASRDIRRGPEARLRRRAPRPPNRPLRHPVSIPVFIFTRPAGRAT